MKDYATNERLKWLRRLQHGGKNAHGIDAEELSYFLSERAALVLIAVMVYGVLNKVGLL